MSSTWERYGELQVRVLPYGEKTLFVGPGVTNATGDDTRPGDWEALASHLKMRVLVPVLPFRTDATEYAKKNTFEGGEHLFPNLPARKHPVPGWRRWYRTRFVEAVTQSEASILLGHSGGVGDVLSADQQRLKQGGRPFERVILANVPVTHVNLMGSRGSGIAVDCIRGLQISNPQDVFLFETLDVLLFPLWQGKNMNGYRALLLRHWNEYGRNIKGIMKQESPEKTNVIEEILIQLAEDSPSPTTIIAGGKDLLYFHHRQDMKNVLEHRNDAPTLVEYDTGHYLPIDCPEEVASTTRDNSRSN